MRRRQRRLQNQLKKRQAYAPSRQARPFGQPHPVASALRAILPSRRTSMMACAAAALVGGVFLIKPSGEPSTGSKTASSNRVELDWQSATPAEESPSFTAAPQRPERQPASEPEVEAAQPETKPVELAQASESDVTVNFDPAETDSAAQPRVAEAELEGEENLAHLPEPEVHAKAGWLARLFGWDKEANVAVVTPDQAEVVIHPPEVEEPAVVEPLGPEVHHYTIAKGDTLSGLFSRFGIGQAEMYRVLEADYSVLALDTLMPGNDLILEQDRDTHALNRLELVFNVAHRVVYERQSDDSFAVEETRLDGDWIASAVDTEINGSFYLSAERAGLTPAEITRITTLFKDKLDFRRQLRAGDTVRVLREAQYVEGEATGQDRLLAVIFAGRNWEQSAYLHDDGSYYDNEGNSLSRAFMRVPVKGKYRLSSHFNGNRRHPVTGRVAPHNGTDFAAPTGTPILAAGDGRITRVENHPIAGKYVVIEHGGQYRTRYLHMSRIDVKRGQTVTRGQQIGAIGATGRVTGPHLHYEFHIRGRPVNAMTANIPMATSVEKAEKQAFLAKVYQYQAQMAQLAKTDHGDDTASGPAGAG
ncbi:peptidoglycan DD-metalloendopeptidase family protein [Ferrimonas balearica]|uniref:peptidoglycan DD-metalloendopeptidase family protein n=1 Tax=Ferrimonas balearica TaxID=44012 RepID=UPI001C99698F|nr:peptidoglycan DD-metalloendopeptidase family protein [Ferrimonas balearica]MBY5920679.1 peptidoglycan DD-metalloendopeptidase family protein [Ferrimonas balearica]MBY5996636.1 peptidoglycan DD-metalloendopeptidase family protein [Ferrimonas balearica]